MSTNEKYNGWTNYATWRVNLELIEDYADSMLQDVDAGYLDRCADVSTLADVFSEYVDEALTGFGEKDEGIAVSYARAFVNNVDWHEIAEHWRDELVEPDDADEDDDADDDSEPASPFQAVGLLYVDAS